MKPNYLKSTLFASTKKNGCHDQTKIVSNSLFFENLVTWKNEEISQIKTYTIILADKMVHNIHNYTHDKPMVHI